MVLYHESHGIPEISVNYRFPRRVYWTARINPRISKLLGFNDETVISRWEHGGALPNLVSDFRFSTLCEVPVDVLFADCLRD